MSEFPAHRGPRSHVLTPDENRRGGSSRSPAKKRAAAAIGRQWWTTFKQTPKSDDSIRRGGTAWGYKTSAMRRECADCGLITTPGALGQHQIFREHSGYIEHPPNTPRSTE